MMEMINLIFNDLVLLKETAILNSAAKVNDFENT